MCSNKNWIGLAIWPKVFYNDLFVTHSLTHSHTNGYTASPIGSNLSCWPRTQHWTRSGIWVQLLDNWETDAQKRLVTSDQSRYCSKRIPMGLKSIDPEAFYCRIFSHDFNVFKKIHEAKKIARKYFIPSVMSKCCTTWCIAAVTALWCEVLHKSMCRLKWKSTSSAYLLGEQLHLND